MPWYNYWRPNYWRRRRWGRRRRPRYAIRRRFHRRHRVRRKLKTISIRQWQPPQIRKCKITGLNCLLYFNRNRISHNGTLYEDSIVPNKLPGGGGFSVMQFTLSNLYDIHQKCNNWWTVSNDNMPLCRYMGCTIKFYQSKLTDYVVKYSTHYPTNSNKLTYPSCQPHMLLMSKNKITIPSKATQQRKHPYIKVKIPPPQQFETKWYFQKDIATKPLVLLYTAAASLDNYYIEPQAKSNNITILHLNTKLIQNRHFSTQIPQAYFFKTIGGTLNSYFYYTRELGDINNVKISQIIPLTNAKQWTMGMTYEESHSEFETFKRDWHLYWGNPFMTEYLHQTDHIYQSTVSPDYIKSKWTSQDTKLSQIESGRVFTKIEEPIMLETRYNPNKDTGEHNKCFLLSNQKAEHGWDNPQIPDIELDGFPLWLLLFGYIDFQKKLAQLQKIDTEYILCFQTNFTYPKYNYTFVPLDITFWENKSPYIDEEQPTKYDQDKWYPQVQYQEQTINAIVKSGPGTPKNTQESDELKCKYTFYWKWGGAPAKMTIVDNPIHQAVYPIPNNEYETTSLQSPTQPIETLLYSFDERNLQLTKRAAERIMYDWETKTNLLSITDPTSRQEPTEQTLQALLNKAPTEEKEKETLQKQLQLLRQQQLQLRNRILLLMCNSQNVE